MIRIDLYVECRNTLCFYCVNQCQPSTAHIKGFFHSIPLCRIPSITGLSLCNDWMLSKMCNFRKVVSDGTVKIQNHVFKKPLSGFCCDQILNIVTLAKKTLPSWYIFCTMLDLDVVSAKRNLALIVSYTTYWVPCTSCRARFGDIIVTCCLNEFYFSVFYVFCNVVKAH